MARRESYLDTYTGEADKGIRDILNGGRDEDEDNRVRLKKVLLKVINNELTARQKQIIMLYYFKGHDITEIGEMLGVTPQAVSAVMARARMRMYKILQYYI